MKRYEIEEDLIEEILELIYIVEPYFEEEDLNDSDYEETRMFFKTLKCKITKIIIENENL